MNFGTRLSGCGGEMEIRQADQMILNALGPPKKGGNQKGGEKPSSPEFPDILAFKIF